MGGTMGKRSENRVSLTVKFIKDLAPGPKDQIWWDADVPGLGLKVTPAGAKVFFCYYRNRAGQQRKPTVGKFGVLTVQKAREIAKKWLVEAGEGRDPSAERKESRKSETVAELITRYLEYAKTRKKARSYREDERNLDNHIKAAWGTRKAASITRADVARLHHAMREAPIAANRVRAVLSSMFRQAEIWGVRPEGSNPVANVKPYKETKRERYLSAAELARLDKTLADAEAGAIESPVVVAAIRLLLLTGCRMGEVLNLKWANVDLEAACLNLADSKTGARAVYLNKAAAAVLAEVRKRKHPAPWVFPDPHQADDKPAVRLRDLEKPWARLRKLAGLEDVRLHDLRHTFASMAAGMGEGLPVVGRLLGHRVAATTARYSHVAPDPARQASERIGQEIMAALAGGAAEVVEIHPTENSKPADKAAKEAKG